jgi:NADH dehydrogenase [ubiquinone] 1 alpha subcomplex assembly factor 1
MTAIPQDASIIFDFQTQQSINTWYIVNDGVMGGLSKGTMSINDAGNAIFAGYVTTENNGGFSSVRHSFKTKDVSNYSSVKIKLKGDGKRYEFRVKDDENQRYSYIQYFETSGEWETISIPLKSFYASFRGRKLDKPNYSGQQMEEVTFLIANGKKESFTLEIERIYLN